MSDFDELTNDELENEEDLNIITLTDEDGSEKEFEFLDLIDYEGKSYVVLLSLDEDDDTAIILEVNEIDEDTEEYLGVDDAAVLNAVFSIFKEHFKDEFSFIDEA